MNLGTINAPRGIRNNNPGNVRKGADQWQGLAPADQQTDPDFWIFSDPVYGIRVIAYLLIGYQIRKGKQTIRELISGNGGWAPVGSADQNPAAYSAYVAGVVGVSQDDPVNLSANRAALVDMVTAIISFENGQQPYGDATIGQGVDLARQAWGIA